MIKGILNNLAITIIPVMASWLIRVIDLTMRSTMQNIGPYKSHAEGGKGFILAFWHGRLLMIPKICKDYGMTVLVSKHRDGEFIARTVSSFGIKSVRGSSTRGWFGGIKGLLKTVKRGGNIAITPDGPKGPARVAQSGIVQIAQKTGLPIVPVSFNSSKKKLFRAGTASFYPAFSLRGSIYSAISSV
jgi:lysophospholipid acyltransferase (LPLAT)-like uncharacterized protein